MIAEVDDQLGRILDWLDETGQADRTLVDLHVRSRRDCSATTGSLHKLGWFDQSYHVPLIVRDPRAGSTRRAAASSTRSPSTSTCCRRSATCSAPTCRCSATAARSRRGSTATTPDDWRARGALRVRLPRPRQRALEEAFGLTLEECSLAVLRDDHGKYVQFSGHPTLPPIFFDLDADPAQLVEPSPPIPRTRRRCSTTRSACSRGACSTPSARSPA